MRRSGGRSLIGCIAVASFVAGCASPPATHGTGAIDHVVIIVEENKPANSILGASSAPYLNQLAAGSALAANYAGITHPSLPNYLALTSGTTAGITGDCSPKEAGCTADVRSIAEAVAQSGRSWKSYAEGMPAPCHPKNSGRYAVRHNPFMYYPGVTADQGSCAAHIVPATALEEDLKSASSLPDFVLLIPDLCNDMHDCPVKTGDDWLSRQVPKILASPAFTTQNSLLVITWDEGDDSTNQSLTIFAGPAARTAVRSDAPYNHYALLRTIENVWGLPPLTENDRSAPAMGDLLK